MGLACHMEKKLADIHLRVEPSLKEAVEKASGGDVSSWVREAINKKLKKS